MKISFVLLAVSIAMAQSSATFTSADKVLVAGGFQLNPR
jgi:hypothetical protein